MNYSVNKRTLTWLSKLGFGKYADCTIKNVYDLGFEGEQYLIWVYFKYGKIDFNQEIIDSLYLKNLVIEKPSNKTDLEVNILKKDWLFQRNKTTEDSHLKNYRFMIKGKKLKYENQKKVDSKIFSKLSMRDRNHGKQIIK